MNSKADMDEAVQRLESALSQAQNRATIHDEKGVKRLVKRMLDKSNVAHFMPPANGFGKSGVSDIVAVKHGRVAFIETKYGKNKPTANQLAFGSKMTQAGALFSVVSDKNAAEQMTRVLLYLETGKDIVRIDSATT